MGSARGMTGGSAPNDEAFERRIELRFRSVASGVRGVAQLEGGAEQAFDGWLDLLGLLRLVAAGGPAAESFEGS
jgi:hypothetical protein